MLTFCQAIEFSQIIILSSVWLPDVNQELILKMLRRQNQCQKVCLQTEARYIRFFHHNIIRCFYRYINVDQPSKIFNVTLICRPNVIFVKFRKTEYLQEEKKELFHYTFFRGRNIV